MFATVQFDDQDPWKPNFLDTLDVERVMHLLAQTYVAIPSYRRQAEAIDMVVECHHLLVVLHLSVRLLSQFMHIHPVHSEPVLSLVGWPLASQLVPLMFTRGPAPGVVDSPRHLVCPLTLKCLQFVVLRHHIHIDVLQDNHYYLMDQWHPELIARICRYAETIFWHHARHLEGPPAIPATVPLLPQAVDPELSLDDTLGDESEVAAKITAPPSFATTEKTPTLQSQASFIGNEVNLRHNDYVVIDDLQEVECTYEPDSRTLASPPPLRQALRPSTRQNRPCSPAKPPLRPATPQSQPVTRQTLFRLPRRLRPLLSVVETGYFFDEFASSESVPRYIKDNKRLKFIKVGKVQKYVNLFEEKTDEVLPSPMRLGPSSPRKQSAVSSPLLAHPRSMDAF
ncbi:hypothetical protein JNB11_05645 [Kocuria palustris]|nr:hypothetical protein [Kocuria palustris]